jgi:ADP-heptose:LPS heptosyltransferase
LTHIDWFVLQKTPDNQNFAARSGLKVQDLSPGWVDLLDTASLMTSLDLTVSICSAPLHLAGALGLTAWGLISAAPDWRWGQRGETSPWYPNLRLFRQETLFDWAPVVEKLKSALAAYPVGGGPK